MKRELKAWTCLESRIIHQTPGFKLHKQLMCSPDESYKSNFYHLESLDWIHLIPITKNSEVVLVRQFRHGIKDFTLELPGGMLDRAEEDPAAAAARELEEETGYCAREITPLGSVHPNPAILTNRCHTFLATGVEQTGKQNLDPAEDISVHLVTLSDIPQMILDGEITYGLMVAAFFKLFSAKGHPYTWEAVFKK